MTSQNFDIIIIGAGPGGYVAAIRAAQLGLQVACVEREAALGGTCLRIGCIPSKALLESSERFWEARERFSAHGISTGDLKLDLPTMLKRKEQVVGTLTKGVDLLFKKNKVTRYCGTARIERRGTVLVNNKQGPTELKPKHIIIATGSKPATIPGVELNGDLIGTSTEALCYPEAPKHLVGIGGGYIGLGLGSG